MPANPDFELTYKAAYEKYGTPLLTIQEAMDFLRISRTTLDRLKNNPTNELSYSKIGNSIRFSLVNLVKYSLKTTSRSKEIEAL